MKDISSVILILIAINGLMTYQGLKDMTFFNKYCFDIGAIKRGQQYRFVSSAFLHVDWMHFIFNMMTLYFFGDLVLFSVGLPYFLLIYFGSLVLGNLLSYKLYNNNPFYRAVGASGAIMGVLYASIMMYPDMTVGVFFILPMPSYLFAILYLLYSVYGLKKANDSIGHSAHIGGALAGLILVIAYYPTLLITQWWLVGLLLIPIVALLWLYKTKRLN